MVLRVPFIPCPFRFFFLLINSLIEYFLIERNSPFMWAKYISARGDSAYILILYIFA